MLHRLHRFIITRWILTRMAAQEFYFRQPFDLPAEFPTLKTILVLASLIFLIALLPWLLLAIALSIITLSIITLRSVSA